jgi:hypothetical protein
MNLLDENSKNLELLYKTKNTKLTIYKFFPNKRKFTLKEKEILLSNNKKNKSIVSEKKTLSKSKKNKRKSKTTTGKSKKKVLINNV